MQVGDMKPDSIELWRRRREEETFSTRLSTIFRLRENYKNEQDRAYAEELWGSLLRDVYGLEP